MRAYHYARGRFRAVQSDEKICHGEAFPVADGLSKVLLVPFTSDASSVLITSKGFYFHSRPRGFLCKIAHAHLSYITSRFEAASLHLAPF
jgi:hypothetical protein